MANDDDGHWRQIGLTENAKKRYEIQTVINNLRRQIRELENLKKYTESLYKDFVLQEDRLVNLDVILLNTNEKLYFEFEYYLSKIDYYAHIDNIPGIDRLLGLEDFSWNSSTYRSRLYNYLFDEDGYKESIKKYIRNNIDEKYKRGCGEMLDRINREIDIFNSWLTDYINRLNSIPLV